MSSLSSLKLCDRGHVCIDAGKELRPGTAASCAMGVKSLFVSSGDKTLLCLSRSEFHSLTCKAFVNPPQLTVPRFASRRRGFYAAVKLSLKPGEKFVLNGAVLANGDKRTSLILQNKACVLREKLTLCSRARPSTPARRIYLPIMI